MATGLFNLKQVNQAISQGAWSGYIAPRWVEYLCVAGGGGGGAGGGGGGGGGAGGLLTGIVTVAAGTSYTVTVGGGGTAGASANGGDGVASVFGSISATGGGGGGWVARGANGGSGGGNGANVTGFPVGLGIVGQGNSGNIADGNAIGGGGGGAGTAGIAGVSTQGGAGGAGIASSISGTVIAYSGGGGGGGSGPTPAGAGGVGGGGGGGTSSGVGTAAATNTGGGGGAGGGGNVSGGTGGSGIVVVRYPGNVQFFTGGTVNYNNGYIIHIFTSNGTLAPTTPAPYNTSYQISRSLRFNSADSAYLDRAQTTGNTQIATWSGWVKRSALTIGAFSTLFSAGAGNTDSLTFSNTGDTLRFFLNGSLSADLVTTQVFRDPSAWYHIVVAIDTTQATAANRIKLYVNGVQVTSFATEIYPTQNYTFTRLNTSGYSANLGSIGTGSFLSAYMTEVNFVDGQQLAATSFGATSTTTGIWSPIQYTGTYGTNGFYVNFSDNSNTTAATLGKDYSGNGNNWTPNNFSVTAGAGNDSLVDSPTSYGTDTGVGGTVRGNYATFNSVDALGSPTLSNGNLQLQATGASYQSASSTIFFPTTGKWYWEVTLSTYCSNGENQQFAIGDISIGNGNGFVNSFIVYSRYTNANYWYGPNGVTPTELGSNPASTGQVVQFAYDADTGKFWAGNTNSWFASGNPTNGTSPLYTFSSIIQRGFAAVHYGSGGVSSLNFGQRPFAYTAPSGFKALCTQNLPTPTIGATSATLAGKFFNPVIYTGAGGSQAITGVGFQPDWVWMKRRSAAGSHILQNAITGVTKGLQSNDTSAEFTDATTLTAFDSDGFTAGGNSQTNASGSTYVAWNWKANGSGASNSAGSITSTVSANTTSGFSVVTYTGTGANATVGHGLGVAPSMVIVKSRTNAYDWLVYNSNIGNTKKLYLNLTDAEGVDSTAWNNTSPTSSVFSLGSNVGVNQSSSNYVAYCFAPVAGYSAFGSYTGNGSADGPFVFTGFRPAYVMVKRTSSSGTNWQILDTKRSTYNVMADYLYASAANAEGYDTSVGIDSLSNGFKIRGTDGNTNTSTATYIYMAFAENPFKYSLAR